MPGKLFMVYDIINKHWLSRTQLAAPLASACSYCGLRSPAVASLCPGCGRIPADALAGGECQGPAPPLVERAQQHLLPAPSVELPTATGGASGASSSETSGLGEARTGNAGGRCLRQVQPDEVRPPPRREVASATVLSTWESAPTVSFLGTSFEHIQIRPGVLVLDERISLLQTHLAHLRTLQQQRFGTGSFAEFRGRGRSVQEEPSTSPQL